MGWQWIRDGKIVAHSGGKWGEKPMPPPEVSRQWPAMLLPLKALAKPGDRGAGDIISRVIGPIGGYAFKKWYRRLFGRDCGCGHRQEVLNARWPL